METLLRCQTRRFSNHESRLLSRSHTFAIIVILDLKIHQSMWIHWPFFPKTWTKGHWPLDHLWPHVCWGHMCDSTQGSLCPSPMTIHQCMWIQWQILQITTYIHILHTYYIHTTYIHTTYYVQNEWSHSLLLNSVQARQKGIVSNCICTKEIQRGNLLWRPSCHHIWRQVIVPPDFLQLSLSSNFVKRVLPFLART